MQQQVYKVKPIRTYRRKSKDLNYKKFKLFGEVLIIQDYSNILILAPWRLKLIRKFHCNDHFHTWLFCLNNYQIITSEENTIKLYGIQNALIQTKTLIPGYVVLDNQEYQTKLYCYNTHNKTLVSYDQENKKILNQVCLDRQLSSFLFLKDINQFLISEYMGKIKLFDAYFNQLGDPLNIVNESNSYIEFNANLDGKFIIHSLAMNDIEV